MVPTPTADHPPVVPTPGARHPGEVGRGQADGCGCAHDHAGHDHAGHDHAGHDHAAAPTAATRAALVRRGLRLGYFGLAYNFVEAGVSLAAGLAAGSVSLVGFGADAAIEFTSSISALWRLHADHDETRREVLERITLRVIGVTLLALAAYVGWEAVEALRDRRAPDRSPVGLVIATLSLAIMPFLARAKRRVAYALGSGALVIESHQTSICAWLSAILLAGLALNALFGWWWADPVAALAMVPLIAREGIDGVRGRNPCGDGCGMHGLPTA